jgi:hypothetical protein
MRYRIFSFIFLATSAVIGLGAFGHAQQWWTLVQPVLSSRIPDPRMLRMLLAVWLFVSGCMLGFALVLIWAWARIRKGDRGVAAIPIGIAAFYFVFGVLSWIGVGGFYAVFVILGASLFTSTLILNARTIANRP